MRISVTIFVILISTCVVNASVLDPVIENVVHLKASKPPSGVAGIWKKKTIWKPRWVKEWKSAKVVKPVWKKVWSPVQIREWVPIPKPPPGWDSISTPLTSVHPKPQKAPLKDSTGHDSFTVPLWDPIPYPESQQPPPPPPPPPPFPQPSCGKRECDNSHAAAFNHQQISEIIGPRYSAPEYSQNAEYSETVNHLTRLPPDGNGWRSPLPDSPGGFPALPEFLVPPMFHSLPDNHFRLQLNYNQQPHLGHVPNLQGQLGHSSAFQPPNGLRQWTPLPPEMNTKGHFVTKAPDHPSKLQFPQMELLAKNKTDTAHKDAFSNNDAFKHKPNPQTDAINTGFRPQTDGDIVQEAHLVGEYHYSEFDLPNIKPNVEEKDEDSLKPQPNANAVGVTAQKPKPNHQPLGGAHQNRTQTKMEVRHPQNGQHVQKKHISNSPSNASNINLNFLQQTPILKDIFPLYDFPLRINSTLIPQNHRFAPPAGDNSNHKKHLPNNHSSTLLHAVEQASRFNSSRPNITGVHHKQNYPVYEIPQIQTVIPSNHRFSPPSVPNFNTSATDVNTLQKEQNYPQISTIIPPNHKFSPPSDTEFQGKQLGPDRYTTKLLAVAPDKVAKSEKPLFEKKASVQLVFPSSPDVAPETTHKDLQKTTTTEPYSVIFSSSLSSTTTEAVSKIPVVVVTPLSQNKS